MASKPLETETDRRKPEALSSSRESIRIERANRSPIAAATTNAVRLHKRQVVCSFRFAAMSSMAKIDNRNGRAELFRRKYNRNLSTFDHSWTEPLRNATTTPANPASVTATCALALNASLGCILNEIRLCPFLNQIRVHVKTIAHRRATVEHQRGRRVREEKSEIARQNLVNVAEP